MLVLLPSIANGKIEQKSLKNLFFSKVSNFKQAFFKIPAPTFLHYGCLCLILLLAIVIRILPIRYGLYLSEFDPYFQYRITNHLVENGFTSYFSWHDYISWYPWGRTVYLTSYPGVAFTSALLFSFLELIGMELTVYQLCTFFPVMMGAATCFIIYLLGKDIGGRSVGLLSALFLTFNSSHIFRTSLGFFDDETIGIFALILSFFFYLRALQPQRSIRSNIFYSLLSGLSLSYLSFSWGAFRYPIGLIALFSFIILIIGRYSSKLLITYGATFGLTFLAMSQIPNLGYAFFKEWPTLAVLAIFLLLVTKDLSGRINKPAIKTGLIFGTILFLIISTMVLWQNGVIISLAGRFQSVINPSTRIELPIVESVAEHRLATWATFFHEFGMLSLIGIFGFYFILQKSREKDIFLLLFGITSLYFASSLVRLSIIFAPAILILAAITITELGKPSVDIIRGTIIFPKRKMRFISKVGKEYGIAILLILVLLLIPTINGAVDAAGTPATIVTSSLPVVRQQPQDWLEAIAWMKENLEEDAVVMAWWDYGYWITTIAGKHTLADNGTINSTQIATIARAFLSNETEAIPILKKYDVSNVAILVTWYSEQEQLKFYGYGEDSKWYWMARISNNTEYEGETVRYFSKQVGEGEDAYIKYDRLILVDKKIISNETIVDKSGLNRSTVLGYLMHNGIVPSGAKTSEFFNLEFTSSNRFVFVYGVDYPESTTTSSSLSNNLITYNQSVTISGKLINSEQIGIPNSTIILQHLFNNGTRWIDIAKVSTNDNGEYEFKWTPDGGDHLIRAKYDGVSGSYLSSISSNQTLAVMKSDGSLEVSLTPSTLSLGESVAISCKFIPVTSGGTVNIGYSSDGETWFGIAYGDLINGSFSYTWTPEFTGEFLIQAVWEGNSNFNEVKSETQILTIDEK